MESKICHYCQEEITDKGYLYIWFAEEKQYKPVHSIHLDAGRGMKKGEVFTPVFKNKEPTE